MWRWLQWVDSIIMPNIKTWWQFHCRFGSHQKFYIPSWLEYSHHRWNSQEILKINRRLHPGNRYLRDKEKRISSLVGYFLSVLQDAATLPPERWCCLLSNPILDFFCAWDTRSPKPTEKCRQPWRDTCPESYQQLLSVKS